MFENLTPVSILIAASYIVASVILICLIHIILKNIIKKSPRIINNSFLKNLLLKTEKPVYALILLTGLYFSTLYLSWSPTVSPYIRQAPAILLVLASIYVVTTIVVFIIKWYDGKLKTHIKNGLASRMLPWLQSLITFLSVLGAILATLAMLGVNAAPITGWLGAYGGRILLVFTLAVIAVIAIARFTPRLIETAISRRTGESKSELKKRSETLSRVIINVGQVIILLIASLTVLSEFIDITTVIASLGVVGIAIGFGAQSLVKDLLAGLFVILENQYRVGDIATIAGVTGEVEDINLRRTMLRDFDGTVHIIPNGEIRVASNLTKDQARVNIKIIVAYNENLEQVFGIINKVGVEPAEDKKWAPMIIKPPQALRVEDFGSSGISIRILGEVKPASQWEVTGELRKRLKLAFDAAGVSTRWPQTNVFIGEKTGTPQDINRRKNID